MHKYFNFADQVLNTASPIIAQWANKNHIGLLDFDACFFDKNIDDVLSKHIQWIAENYNSMTIVESHPFFSTIEEYVEKIEKIKDQAARLNLPTMSWTADYRLWDNIKSDNQTFVPVWYFLMRQHAVTHNYQTYAFPENKQYNFSCCNMSNYRFEKIYNYIECYKRKRSDWYLTLYNHPDVRLSDMDIKDIGPLGAVQKQVWNSEIKYQIPEYQYDLQNNENLNALSVIFEGHTNAYCNLVMEHSMEVEIVSEKSFKPFIAGQIPVYCASLGAAKFISSLGFDLFYDFINHDNYDSIVVTDYESFDNSIARITAVHKEIDKRYNTPFAEYFHRPDVKQRLEKNKERFYSDAIDHMTIQHLDKLIKR